MKNALRKAIMLLLVLLFTASFAACQQNEKNTATDDVKSTTKVEKKEVVPLKITMPTDWYGKGWEAAAQNVQENADKLGYTLDFDRIAGDSAENILKVRFATGDLPDLLCYFQYRDIRDKLRAADKVIDLTGDWMNNYNKEALGIHSDNGKVYGVPCQGCSLGAVYYNKKVFAEAGVEIPKTWDEFTAVCDKIKSKGVTPFFIAGKDSWTLQLIPIFGFYRDLNGRDVASVVADWTANKIKTPELKGFVDSFAKQNDILAKGYANKNWLSDTYDNQVKALAEGTAAMVAQASWIVDQIVKSYPDKVNDIGAFAMPFEGSGVVPNWIPGAVYAFKTANAEKAAEFAKYFASKEVQETYFKAQSGIPVINGINVDLPAPTKEAYALYSDTNIGKPLFQQFELIQYNNWTQYMQDYMVGGKTLDQLVQAIDNDRAKDAKNKKVAGW